MAKAKPLDLENRQALLSMRRAVRRIWAEARRTGEGVAIWRDGRVVTVYPGKKPKPAANRRKPR